MLEEAGLVACGRGVSGAVDVEAGRDVLVGRVG